MHQRFRSEFDRKMFVPSQAGWNQAMQITNRLFYGDNLHVLREHVPDDSVDLIYLDPPFNSNANYNILFRSPTGEQSNAQIEAFEDSWHWNDASEDAFDQVARSGNTRAFDLLNAMRAFLGHNDMMAYLAMMAVRLIELHRVLKPTGSLYLHCDPTASHYLKLLLDGVFGPTNYLNEIIWRRTGSHNNAKRFGPVHDVIHFYRKGDGYRHRPVFRPYTNGHVDSYFRKTDDRGRYWGNSIHGAGLRGGDSGKPWRGYDPSAAKRHWAVPSDLVTAFGIDPELPQHAKLDALADFGVIDFPDPKSGSLPPIASISTAVPDCCSRTCGAISRIAAAHCTDQTKALTRMCAGCPRRGTTSGWAIPRKSRSACWSGSSRPPAPRTGSCWTRSAAVALPFMRPKSWVGAGRASTSPIWRSA